MSEPEVLFRARELGRLKKEWSREYQMARMNPDNKSAKDAEAIADEMYIEAIHEAEALYFIAKSRLGGTTDADPR